MRNQVMSNLEEWLSFLAANSDEVLDKLRNETKCPELTKAIAELEYASLSESEKCEYLAQLEAIKKAQASRG
jgi:hypothetical protein